MEPNTAIKAVDPILREVILAKNHPNFNGGNPLSVNVSVRNYTRYNIIVTDPFGYSYTLVPESDVSSAPEIIQGTIAVVIDRTVMCDKANYIRPASVHKEESARSADDKAFLESIRETRANKQSLGITGAYGQERSIIRHLYSVDEFSKLETDEIFATGCGYVFKIHSKVDGGNTLDGVELQQPVHPYTDTSNLLRKVASDVPCVKSTAIVVDGNYSVGKVWMPVAGQLHSFSPLRGHSRLSEGAYILVEKPCGEPDVIKVPLDEMESLGLYRSSSEAKYQSTDTNAKKWEQQLEKFEMEKELARDKQASDQKSNLYKATTEFLKQIPQIVALATAVITLISIFRPAIPPPPT